MRSLLVSSAFEEDKFRILIHSTGYEDTLFLPLTQSMPLLSYLGVVSQWQLFDEPVYVCHLGRMTQLFFVNVFRTRRKVPRNGFRRK